MLIVDDEESIVFALRSTFKGYEIKSFNDSFSAIENLKSNQYYDILIIDLKLKGMSGIDILIEAKKNLTSYKSLLITAYPTEYLLQGSIDKDLISHVLYKPFSLKEITLKVNNLYDELLEEQMGIQGEEFLKNKGDRVTENMLVFS